MDQPKKRIRDKKAYSNQSVLVGTSVLHTLAKMGGPATLAEIAEASGMLVARTHRYITSLVKAGLVVYDDESSHYDLGSLVLELGLLAIDRLDPIRLGSQAIRKLTEKLNLTSTLSVWGSNGATIVKCEMARKYRLNRIREGANVSLLTSATGRIFLSYLSRLDTIGFLEQELSKKEAGAAGSPSLSKINVDDLCAEIKRRGMAANIGETYRDALAAPIFNYEGKLVMVITVIGNAKEIDMGLSSAAANNLKNCAEELSRQFGGRRVEALSP